MQIEKTNPFLKYASEHPSEVKSLILENTKTISQNALTISYISLDLVNKVVPLSLNLNSLRFVPSKSYTLKNSTYTQYFTSIVSNALGWQHPDEINNSPENIKDFFDFLCAFIGDLTHLEVGEESSPFTAHFLKQYKSLNYGLIYLSESYRLGGRRADSEIVLSAQKSLDSLRSCCVLVEDLESKYPFANKIGRAHV